MRGLLRWTIACALASTVGASLSYLSVAPGPLRLLADGLIVGSLQAIALGAQVRQRAWFSLTVVGILLAVLAAIVIVLVTGLVFGPLEQTNREVYVVIVYGLGAAVGGLAVSFVQSPALPRERRLTSWLLGNAVGAPFVFPALVLSWFAPENVTVPVPAWLIGLGGGLAYGFLSGLGLFAATPRR